jgi:hypothetical protein
MLNIERRAAVIGRSLNGRVEQHGDEGVPAIDIALEDIVLSEAELNALLRDPQAADCLFQPPGGTSTLAQPRFPQLAALRLREKIKGVNVTIWLQGSPVGIKLPASNLAKVELEPQEGGTTALSCQVQASEPADKSVARLFEQLGHTVSVEIVEGQADVEDARAAA